MMRANGTSETNFAVTAEQIARLEQALLSLHESTDGAPEVIETIAAIQYSHILDLRAELDAALGFGEQTPDLVVSVGGAGIGLGTAPLSLVWNIVGRFNIALQNIVGFLMTEEAPRRGRPLQSVSRAAELQFAGVRPGSIRVMLNVHDPLELLPQFGREPLERAIGHMSQVATWASSQDEFENLRTDLHNDNLVRVLLSQVQQIAPDSDGKVEYIALSGRLVNTSKEVFLTRNSRRRLGDAFGELHAGGKASVNETGRLRQVDVDLGVFQLRDRPEDQPPLRCRVPKDLLSQALGYLVEDAMVTLEGVQELDGYGRPSILNVIQVYLAQK